MIELKTAKYKGVEFLFLDMSTTGGNRLIKFNFPGSDKQAIERQGELPRTFNLTAIIPHEDYYQERDKLLKVLEDGETGTLTHPTFGDIENIISGTYTLTESLSELGRAQVAITFELNNAPGIPQQSGELASQVQTQSDALNDQLEADLAENYEVSSSFSDNFTDAVDNVNDVSAAIARASNFADPLLEKIAVFRQTVNNFSGSVRGLIQAPADLASSVRGMFEDLNTLYNLPGDLLGAFSLLFSFGADDPKIAPTTIGKAERKQNRDLIRASIRVQALSYTYVAATRINYETAEDLDAVQAVLEAQYLDARGGRLLPAGGLPAISRPVTGVVDTAGGQLLSSGTIELLDRLRVQAQKTLDAGRVSTRSVITIETPRVPLTVLVFDYYGSTDLTATIAELNDIKQSAFVEGRVKVLTL